MTDDLHHLAAAYALNALDDAERQAFENHYPSCEICAQEVVEFQETAALLADAEAVAPPAGLDARVMAEIARTRQVSPRVPERVVDLAERRRRRANRPLILATAAAAIVFVVGLAGALFRSQPSDLDQLVAAPDAITTELEGEDGTVEVIWSAERDQVLVTGRQLPALDPGLAYQLWFVVGDGVSPAPTFTVDEGGRALALFDVDDIDALGWGVSVEPETGSLQPTSDVIFIGTV